MITSIPRMAIPSLLSDPSLPNQRLQPTGMNISASRNHPAQAVEARRSIKQGRRWCHLLMRVQLTVD